MQNLNTVDCVARMDVTNKELVLFYLSEKNELVCFAKSEGCRLVGYDYYLKTDYIRESFAEYKQAVNLVKFYNSLNFNAVRNFNLVKNLKSA